MIAAPALIYRRIDPDADASLIVAHHRDASIMSFGSDDRFSPASCLTWVRSRVEEFPDGYVLAFLHGECVGHLELQVPYGLTVGYINLYYVTQSFRRQGFGTLMHEYVDRYIRSWEARRIELHVGPRNRAAVKFYRSVGYRFVGADSHGPRLWKMAKEMV